MRRATLGKREAKNGGEKRQNKREEGVLGGGKKK